MEPVDVNHFHTPALLAALLHSSNISDAQIQRIYLGPGTDTAGAPGLNAALPPPIPSRLRCAGLLGTGDGRRNC